MNYVLRNLTLVFLGILLLSSMSFSVLYVVNSSIAPGGNGPTYCNTSVATDTNTTQEAIRLAVAGDTILICGNGSAGVLIDNPVTVNVTGIAIRGAGSTAVGLGAGGNFSTILVPRNASASMFVINGSNVNLSNLTFTGLNGTGSGFGAVVMNADYATALKLNDSNFTGNAVDVLFSAGGNNSNISGTFHNTTRGTAILIVAAIDNVSINNVTMMGTSTYGNLASPSISSGIYAALIRNLTVSGAWISGFGYGLRTDGVTNLIVNNSVTLLGGRNVFFNNTYGIYLNVTNSAVVRDVWLYNSTNGTGGVNGTIGYGLYLLNSSANTFTNVTVWDNLLYDAYLQNSSSNTFQTNTTFRSPQALNGASAIYLTLGAASNTFTGIKVNESYTGPAIYFGGNSNTLTGGSYIDLIGSVGTEMAVLISGSANLISTANITTARVGINSTTSGTTYVTEVNITNTTNALYFNASNSSVVNNTRVMLGNNGTLLTIANTATGGTFSNLTLNHTSVGASGTGVFLNYADNTVLSNLLVFNLTDFGATYVLVTRSSGVNLSNANLSVDSRNQANQTGLHISTATTNVNVTDSYLFGFFNSTAARSIYISDGTGHTIRNTTILNSSMGLYVAGNTSVTNNTIRNCGTNNNYQTPCLALVGNGNTANSTAVVSNLITNATFYAVSVWNDSATPGAFYTFAANNITNGTYGIFLNNSNLTFSGNNWIQSLLATGFDVYSASGGYFSTVSGSNFYNITNNYSIGPSAELIHMSYGLNASANFAVRPVNVSNYSAIPGAAANWTSFPNVSATFTNVPPHLNGQSWLDAKAMAYLGRNDYLGLNVSTTVGTMAFAPVLYYNSSDFGSFGASSLHIASWNGTHWGWHGVTSTDTATYYRVYKSAVGSIGGASSAAFFVSVNTFGATSGQGGTTQSNSVPSISTKQNCPDDTLTVTVSKSGGVASGATVKFYRENPYLGLLETKTSDSDGKATFATKGTGTYSVEVSGTGYIPTSSTVSYTACVTETATTTPTTPEPTPEAAPEAAPTPAPESAPAGTGAGTGAPAGEGAPSEQPTPAKETGEAGTGKAPEVPSQPPTAAAGATGGDVGTILLVVVVIVVVAVGIYFFTKKGGSSKGIYKGFKR